ncbi:MAG TPA: hypothetical protein VH540_25770 [Ktedonobacterales bacterium]|jgi:hypothetical protein
MAVFSLPPFLRDPAANPEDHPLLALRLFLRYYVTLGGPAWLLPLRWGIALLRFYFGHFLAESYVSTVLCYVLPGILLVTHDRLRQRKRACGGRRRKGSTEKRWRINRFAARDLKQAPADIRKLSLLSSHDLCLLLKEELRLLIRLLIAAQRACWIAPESQDWQECHLAAATVLVRVMQICARLRERGSRFLAEECLREQARALWEELFGPRTLDLAPTWVAERLEPLEDVKPWGKWRALEHLQSEQHGGLALSPVFLAALAGD